MALCNKIQVCIGLLLFCHVMLDVTSVDSQTCEAIVPQDSTAKLGEKEVLKCRLASQNIAWTFCPRNGGSRLITNNCAVVSSASSSYKVDKSNNGCDLVIDNVTTSHLGSYTCQDLSLNDTGHVIKLRNTNENLALGKHTIQSTTDPVGAMYASSNAVDGNVDSNYARGSCIFTLSTAGQWWAVDLEHETSVGHVRLTNIEQPAYFGLLHDFFIGLTNVSPWSTPPNFNQSSICKYFAGTAPAKIPITIFCEPDTLPGRYLFLLKPEANYLTFCELEVYY